MAKEKKLKEEKDNLSTEETVDQETVEQNEEDTSKKEDQQEEKGEVSELDTLKEELASMKDKHVRLQAEFDNYRKRTLKEKMELTKSAGASILVNVLPLMDDFERAMQHIGESNDNDALKEGIELIYGKFCDFLKQNGVSEIETFEKDFDTDIHEAVTKIPAPTEELKGKVVDCIQKGYLLNEKVIRFAKVVIGE